jgi:trk system potassium uptake protein TrkA
VKIIIVGGGVVGTTLAQQLEKEQQKHSITLIESNGEKCRQLQGKLDIQIIHGAGTDPEKLIEGNIGDADLLVAVTASDEINILTCHLAAKFEVPRRVARLIHSRYTRDIFDLKGLGVTDIIQPESETIEYIHEYIHSPLVSEIVNFRRAQIAIRNFTVSPTCSIANHTAAETAPVAQHKNILFLMIHRGEENIVPTGDTKILPGDEILAIMPENALNDFRKICNEPRGLIPKIVITGDSTMALSLAEKTERIAKKNILISDDEPFCQYCSENLHNTDVFLGDPGNEETLTDAGIHRADFFIALDSNGEENVITGLMAKAEGAKHVIAVTNNKKHQQLFHTLGIDHLIQPTHLTIRRLFADIAGISRGAVFKSTRTDVGMNRYTIVPGSKLVGKSVVTIRNMAKVDFIIGCILRGGEFLIARGDSVFEENDDIIVFFTSEKEKYVSRFFGKNT